MYFTNPIQLFNNRAKTYVLRDVGILMELVEVF